MDNEKKILAEAPVTEKAKTISDEDLQKLAGGTQDSNKEGRTLLSNPILTNQKFGLENSDGVIKY